jgi:hypothetical protein
MSKQFQVVATKDGYKTFDFTYDVHEEAYARNVANTLSAEGWSVSFTEWLDDSPRWTTMNDLDHIFGAKTRF